ncbi:MAG TPA: kynureninase [bacterium]|nr:kynureninase [bacterium]
MKQSSISRSFARSRDKKDPLRKYRRRFYRPGRAIYMDGNSLGLCSRDAKKTLMKHWTAWKRQGIGGWLNADPPWFTLGENLGRLAAPLVGACPDELVAAGSTTVNIHALLSGFYRPEGNRRKLLVDALNFPTDLYAAAGQIRLHGSDPETDLIRVQPADGVLLAEEEIIRNMNEEVAVALLPSVLYRSGQLLDMKRLAKAAHDRKILIGFDCSHSAGIVDHRLHDWGVDFAMWCSYKYMNGGPGSIAFLFVHRKNFERVPLMTGWWGYVKNRQFDMLPRFEPQRGAAGWQISTPGVFSASPLEGSLQILAEAGIRNIRHKSLALTGYLMELFDAWIGTSHDMRIVTPREPLKRGGHVALEHKQAWKICQALKSRGVIPDFRPPSIIRLAPSALYISFDDVRTVMHRLRRIMDTRAYRAFSGRRDAVS